MAPNEPAATNQRQETCPKKRFIHGLKEFAAEIAARPDFGEAVIMSRRWYGTFESETQALAHRFGPAKEPIAPHRAVLVQDRFVSWQYRKEKGRKEHSIKWRPCCRRCGDWHLRAPSYCPSHTICESSAPAAAANKDARGASDTRNEQDQRLAVRKAVRILNGNPHRVTDLSYPPTELGFDIPRFLTAKRVFKKAPPARLDLGPAAVPRMVSADQQRAISDLKLTAEQAAAVLKVLAADALVVSDPTTSAAPPVVPPLPAPAAESTATTPLDQILALFARCRKPGTALNQFVGRAMARWDAEEDDGDEWELKDVDDRDDETATATATLEVPPLAGVTSRGGKSRKGARTTSARRDHGAAREGHRPKLSMLALLRPAGPYPILPPERMYARVTDSPRDARTRGAFYDVDGVLCRLIYPNFVRYCWRHVRVGSNCGACGGKNECRHGKIRRFCSDPTCGGGQSLCQEHGKDKYNCALCRGAPICRNHGNGCDRGGHEAFDWYCGWCFRKTDKVRAGRAWRGAKERFVASAVYRHVAARYPGMVVIHDEPVERGRCIRRPDLLFLADRFRLIVEIDEHAHNAYDQEDEMLRVLEIQDALGLPTIVLRINVDGFRRASGESVKSPFHSRDLDAHGLPILREGSAAAADWSARIERLLARIDAILTANAPHDSVTVEWLNYDGDCGRGRGRLFVLHDDDSVSLGAPGSLQLTKFVASSGNKYPTASCPDQAKLDQEDDELEYQGDDEEEEEEDYDGVTSGSSQVGYEDEDELESAISLAGYYGGDDDDEEEEDTDADQYELEMVESKEVDEIDVAKSLSAAAVGSRGIKRSASDAVADGGDEDAPHRPAKRVLTRAAQKRQQQQQQQQQAEE
ncbi:hypothetical protein H9P43_009763 [Blastocladiella emersonii ATCC 22665]|nr:hypothetical protein H9P43_009763 [Blastocladiella emersonii ATCC 22665]